MLQTFAPGKVILVGEHAVVYGQPALAAPLSWGVTVTATAAKRAQLIAPEGLPAAGRKSLQRAFLRGVRASGGPKVKLTVQSDLPLSVGLGSSAAVSVACARALLQSAGRKPSVKEVSRVAAEMEKEFHGTPSGVDHSCSAQGELIRFRRRPGARQGQCQVVHSRRPLKLMVALVGERGSTREMVEKLRGRQAQWPQRYARQFAEIGKLSLEASEAIERGDLEALGDAMNVNHGILQGLGLSSVALDGAVHLLRQMGALGAKLTGAGGEGGAVIGLFFEPEPAVAKLTRMGIRCFSSQVAGPRAL